MMESRDRESGAYTKNINTQNTHTYGFILKTMTF